MGLSGHTTKASYYWVYQASQSSQLTIGFIRLSSQGSHMAKCTTRHNQSNYSWVYQASQPSQYMIGFIRLPSQASITLGLSGCHPSQFAFGFIRLLRQWKGRMAKLGVHSIARDTSTRSIWPGIHNTYTPNTRKHPLLCYTVPWDMPSLSMLFRVCITCLLAS